MSGGETETPEQHDQEKLRQRQTMLNKEFKQRMKPQFERRLRNLQGMLWDQQSRSVFQSMLLVQRLMNLT